jgi:hypothetical protein
MFTERQNPFDIHINKPILSKLNLLGERVDKEFWKYSKIMKKKNSSSKDVRGAPTTKAVQLGAWKVPIPPVTKVPVSSKGTNICNICYLSLFLRNELFCRHKTPEDLIHASPFILKIYCFHP